MKKVIIVLILLAAGLGITYLKDSAPHSDVAESGEEKDTKVKDRYAITYCWEQYERKSLTDEEKRFIAGSCEKMEAKFEDKYGTKP